VVFPIIGNGKAVIFPIIGNGKAVVFPIIGNDFLIDITTDFPSTGNSFIENTSG
jgi:hypothetical protein